MKKVYSVAGHCFSISAADGCPVWGKMANYEPFLAGPGCAGPVFSLELADSLPDVEDRTALYVDKSRPEEPRIDLYQAGDRWLAEFAPFGNMKPVAALLADSGFSRGILAVKDIDANGSYAIDNAAMFLFCFSTAAAMTLVMHSSTVVKDGRAYMFLGRSGAGKSTHSRMWLQNIPGTELLNDDNPVVRVGDDGVARVYGSPWSGKTPCYRNASAPAGALVRIVQAPVNRISQQNVTEAYAQILSSSSGFRPIARLADGFHETTAAFALSVPCYTLECLADAGAAETCFNAVR